MTKTKVIGFRVPNRYILEWSIYCDQNNLELAEFLRKCIDGHVNDNIPEDRPIFIMAKENRVKYLHLETLINKSSYLNLRVDVNILLNWDKYCERNHLDRSKLLLDAVTRYMHPGTKAPIREYDRFKRIIQQVIRFFGIIDYRLLATIFDPIDESELINILDTLESENNIMRKADGYITMHDPERMVNIRQIVDNFMAFLPLTPRDNPILPYDIVTATSDLSAHKSLIIVIIEYLKVYLSQYLQLHLQEQWLGQEPLSKSEKDAKEIFQKRISPDQIQIALIGSVRKAPYYVEIRTELEGVKNVEEFVERKQISDQHHTVISEGHLLVVNSEIPLEEQSFVEETLQAKKSKWKFL